MALSANSFLGSQIISADFILLSTFNGCQYLESQLESIVLQHYSNLRVLARDDGSSDESPIILNEYALRYDWFFISEDSGLKLGVTQSYLKLIEQALGSEPRFIAFCDQDDVWVNHRFREAEELLEGSHPQLLMGRVKVVDKDLVNIGKIRTKRPTINPATSIFANQAIGCATVINNSLAKLLVESQNYFKSGLLHDWRAYILASFYGKVIVSDSVWTLYRQHDQNAIGYPTGLERINNYLRNYHARKVINHYLIANSILDFKEPIDPNLINFLRQTTGLGELGFVKRFVYIIRWRIFREDFTGSVVTCMRILWMKNPRTSP